MKKTLLVTLLMAALAFLSGCASQCVPVYKTDYVGPPDALLVKVPVETPPDPEAYNTLSWKQRANLWQNKYDNQTANVGAANRHISSLQDWKKQNNAVFSAATQGASDASGTRP